MSLNTSVNCRRAIAIQHEHPILPTLSRLRSRGIEITATFMLTTGIDNIPRNRTSWKNLRVSTEGDEETKPEGVGSKGELRIFFFLQKRSIQNWDWKLHRCTWGWFAHHLFQAQLDSLSFYNVIYRYDSQWTHLLKHDTGNWFIETRWRIRVSIDWVLIVSGNGLFGTKRLPEASLIYQLNILRALGTISSEIRTKKPISFD